MVPPDLSQQNQMILFIILTLAYLVKGCKILPAHYEVHGDGLKNVIACRYILHSFRYQTKKKKSAASDGVRCEILADISWNDPTARISGEILN